MKTIIWFSKGVKSRKKTNKLLYHDILIIIFSLYQNMAQGEKTT